MQSPPGAEFNQWATAAQPDRAVTCSPERPSESGRSGASRAQLAIEVICKHLRPRHGLGRPVV